jgi:hypothetical protein
MEIDVAFRAESNQVLLRVVTTSAAELDVMNFQT